MRSSERDIYAKATQLEAHALFRGKLARALAAAALALAWSASAQVSVTEGGTASYSVPIVVPPGIAGMAPNMGLSYSGSGVNGPVGYGWGIQGVSTIARCPQTRAIDGFSRMVTYSTDDKLCLDGQRLIQTDANGVVTNGGATTTPTPAVPFQAGDSRGDPSTTVAYHEFRTEKDSFARIRAYGMAGTNIANGPAFFKVWTKSGQIYEYGNNSNATANAAITVQGKSVVAVWAVSRVSDTLGNYIDFQYDQRDVAWGSGPSAGNPTLGHEWSLLEVRYTGTTTPVQAPANKIVFTYIDRTSTASVGIGVGNGPELDLSEAYASGSKNVSNRRLDSIRTYVNVQGATPVKVKTWKLAYDHGRTAPAVGVPASRSRLHAITECAGVNEDKCLPPTTFNYSTGTDSSYTPLSSFNQKTLRLLDATTGNVGILVGDFNGDGLTDFIQWSDTPSQNLLFMNQGNGNFVPLANGTGPGQFSIYDKNLFASTGACYTSITADFNGDGLTDILRFSSCPADPTTYLYLSKGDGSFNRVAVSIPLASGTSTITHDCLNGAPREYPTCAPDHPMIDKWSPGATFYVLDVNGDGILDIVTTTLPAGYRLTGGSIPATSDPCATTVCSHVYLGSLNGTFAELTTPTNVANHSLYSPPRGYSPSKPMSNGDLNGDGLTDLTYVSTDYWEKNAGWVSRGDGNFDPATGGGIYCSYVLDFNADGRSDCLSAIPAFTNFLSAGGAGPGYSLGSVANFNLANEVLVSTVSQTNGALTAGIAIVDMDGDGRADILRWKDDPTQNAVFLSNGDGTFRAASNFNLNTATRALSGSDGLSTFLVGDFTGNGQPEILRLKSQPIGTDESTTNQLYVKTDSTPADQLISVVSPTGLTTTLSWLPLTNSTSGVTTYYKSDGCVATLTTLCSKIDLTIPAYVVTTSVTATGVGASNVSSRYSYSGLKAAFDGRGIKGFRETRRSVQGPDGNLLTMVTQYLQDNPYTGTPSSTSTYVGSFIGNVALPTTPISSSIFTYCDTAPGASAASSATPTAPCTTSAKVQRPYLYRSLDTGVDINASNSPLPTVETVKNFDSSGNPTSIAITTSGSALGSSQTFTKTTTNVYLPDQTGNDFWVLGRLQIATQHNTAPNTLAALGSNATTPGNAAQAGAIQGTAPTPAATLTPTLAFGNVAVGASANLTATLTNTGPIDVSITIPSSASVSGAGFAFVSTTCASVVPLGANCIVTVSLTPNVAGIYTGTLSISTSAGTRTSNLSATGVIPVVFQPVSTNWGTVGAASDSGDWPTIRNNSSVSVLITAHAPASGPAGVWSWQGQAGYCVPGSTALAPGQSCQTFFGTTNLSTPGSYSAVDQISFQVVGGTGATYSAQQAYTFAIATTTSNPSSLGFGNVTVNTSSTAQTFVLTNNAVNGGSVKNLSISVVGSQPSNFPMFHNCGSSLAQGASCTVTVTFGPTSVANGISAAVQVQGGYSRISGGVDSGYTPNTGVNFSVPVSGNGTGLPALTLTSCASGGSSTSPTPAQQTCVLGNTGTVASSISYSTSISGGSASGPTSCAASSGNCGTVTLASPTAAGTYTGTVTATPSTGTGATSGSLQLTVNPAIPTLSSNPTRFDGSTNTNTSPIGSFNVSFTAAATGLSVSTTYGSIINNTCTGTQTVSCSFQWTTPAGKSTGSGTVTVSASNGANTLSIPVTRTYGGPPDSSIATLTSATSQSIPATWYGAGVQSISVTYRSDGTLPLTLNTPSLAAPLSLTGNNCSNVAPGSSCSMTVALATNVGGINQSQALTPTGATTGPGATTVLWNVYTAIPRWSTTSMNMGTVGVGSSASQGITLFNDGNVAYNWASNSTVANLPSGYSFNTGACSNVAPGGGNCAVTVTFTPPGVGTYGGASIYMAAASLLSNSLTITGVGAAPGLTLSSCTTGGSSTSPTPKQQTCVLGNSGTAASSVTYSTTVSGGSATGPSSCAGNTANCGTVTVTSPTAAGTYSGTVTATPNTGTGATSGTLTFTVNSGLLTLSVNPTSFDGVTSINASPVGSFTVSFAGTATGLSVTATYGSIINSTCTGSRTTSCTFQWTTPPGKATNSGTVTVTATNGANTLSIPVSRTYSP